MATEGDEINDSPVEEVRLTVPTVDDPTLPVLTFRTWFLGLTTCIGLSFMDRFFDYRQNPIYISADCVQILILPMGKLMAATLPTKRMRVPGTKWTFSMNPGPFNVKEHVLITIFATSGTDFPYPATMMAMMKVFFHRKFHPVYALLLSITSQMVGYGYIGFLVGPLVDHPRMWWPANLVAVSLFRTLHEVELRPKRQLTKFQFFLIVSTVSFAYYIVPNYFFQSIAALSLVCWIWKDSVTAQQIGSARNGLGLGSVSLDYTSILQYLGNPFATPIDAIVNMMVGFVLLVYVITPIAYWSNSFDAKRFPIFSSDLFDANGQEYNVSRVLNKDTFSVDQHAFDGYSKVHLSVFYAWTYAFSNAMTTAAITHVVLVHGRSIWSQLKAAYYNRDDHRRDVHNRLMMKYEPVPKWWYHAILVSMAIMAIAISVFYNQHQLPVWVILLTIFTNLIVTIPTGVILATSNMIMVPNDFQYLLVTYLFAGKPLAIMTYSAYSLTTIMNALSFLQDLKLAHYMKIAPKAMFLVQIVSTLVSSLVNIFTAWWLLSTVANICEPDKLPKGSPWTCPNENYIYDMLVQEGVVGPAQLFLPHGLYGWTYIFYGVGIVAPIIVWKLSRISSMKWVGLINIPLILNIASYMPPATPVHAWTWGAVGIFFNFYLYNRFKWWWARYNYVLSAGLNIGAAFVTFLLYLALQRQQIYGVNWWGMDVQDHCPLAHCPTAPGIQVDGCPLFH